MKKFNLQDSSKFKLDIDYFRNRKKINKQNLK